LRKGLAKSINIYSEVNKSRYRGDLAESHESLAHFSRFATRADAYFGELYGRRGIRAPASRIRISQIVHYAFHAFLDAPSRTLSPIRAAIGTPVYQARCKSRRFDNGTAATRKKMTMRQTHRRFSSLMQQFEAEPRIIRRVSRISIPGQFHLRSKSISNRPINVYKITSVT